MKVPMIGAALERYRLGRSIQQRAHPSSDAALVRTLAGEASSGVDVTYDNMLSVSAVWAAVNLIANSVAQLPLILYRRLEGGVGRERAVDHPLYQLLKLQPHKEVTSYRLRQTIQGHVCTWGNGYGHVGRDRGGRVVDMLPLRPDRMRLDRDINNDLVYWYRPTAGAAEVRLSADDVLHIRGLSFQGLAGMNPQETGREAIGSAMAADRQAAAFFKNDSTPRGVLTIQRSFNDQAARDRLRREFERTYGGLSNSSKTAILEEGMDYRAIGLSPQVTQLLESRKYSVADVARFYQVPPHMIGDLDRATFSNVEEMAIEFVQYSMMPWLVAWQQELDTTLLSARERESLFFEFNVDALLRGTPEKRAAFYNAGRLNGWLSGDEIRERENLNPIPEGKGAIFWQPLNMVPLGDTFASVEDDDDQVGDGTDDVVPGDPRPRAGAVVQEQRGLRSAASRGRMARSFQGVYAAAIERVIRRERADVMREAEKQLVLRGAGEFDAYLDSFYQPGSSLAELLVSATDPIYAEIFRGVRADVLEELGIESVDEAAYSKAVEDYRAFFVADYLSSSAGQIRSIIRGALEEGADPLVRVGTRFEEWGATRPAKLSIEECFRATNALSLVAYRGAGVRRLRWVTAGATTCPYCKEMNGRVVGIDQAFRPANSDLTPEGARPLHSYRAVKHPPLHQKCDCQIVAA
tara:strand:- start:11 stop:2086 length:2076 start_codon:yes stop_codon:yes gene_type:complete